MSSEIENFELEMGNAIDEVSELLSILIANCQAKLLCTFLNLHEDDVYE